MSQVDFILYAPIGRPDDPDRFVDTHSRQLIAEIKKNIEPLLENYLFELNNARTRASLIDSVSHYLQHTEAYGFRVVCDDTNNTPSTIDNHELHVDLYVQPDPVPEFIHLNVVLGAFPF